MIQRIQSLYLLAVSVLMVTVSFVSVAGFTTPTGVLSMRLTGVYDSAANSALLFGTWPLQLLAVLIALIALATIFLFNNRKLQIKLSAVSLWLIVLFLGAFIVYLFLIPGKLNAAFSFEIPSLLPLAALLLNVLALRAIRADEELVRSLDRLR